MPCAEDCLGAWLLPVATVVACVVFWFWVVCLAATVLGDVPADRIVARIGSFRPQGDRSPIARWQAALTLVLALIVPAAMAAIASDPLRAVPIRAVAWLGLGAIALSTAVVIWSIRRRTP